MKVLRTILLSVFVCSAFASTAFGIHWNLWYRFCPPELIEIPELLERFPIPVGCEVVDCCPGCPGPEVIDWRILVEGEVFSNVALQFDGLSPEIMKGLEVKGAEFDSEGRLLMRPGEARISGLPADLSQVPVGFLEPRIDRALLAKKTEAAASRYDQDGDQTANDDGDDGAGSITIEQYVGRYVVNTFKIRWVWRLCPERAVDRIRVTNNTAGDSVVAVLDYRNSSGCRNDQVYRTASQTGLGTNALTNGSCNTDVSVFSDDNAMSFEPNVTTWTNATGDLHTVNLQPILQVPVSVWLAAPGSHTTATNDMANANLLYNQNNVGVQFVPTYNDVSTNAAAVATIGTGCGSAAGVLGSAFFTANTLNAYYVNSAFTGVNCGASRNLNYLGTTANLGSLPHEFGHAYGLRPSASNGHTNGVPGFGNNNIMWGGGPGTRNLFTAGQAFRINTDTTSMLNANGDRTGPTRTCLPNATSNICPNLALDSTPH